MARVENNFHHLPFPWKKLLRSVGGIFNGNRSRQNEEKTVSRFQSFKNQKTKPLNY